MMEEEKQIRLEGNFEVSQLLAWSQQFPFICFLNSNSSSQLFTDNYTKYDWLLAVSTEKIILKNVFQELKSIRQQKNDWLFGYFGYDLKNQLEKLSSQNTDTQHSEEAFFFRPKYLLGKKDTTIFIEGCADKDEANQLTNQLTKSVFPEPEFQKNSPLQARVSRDEYVKNVEAIQQHIQRGDIYEMNYCIEFFQEKYTAQPFSLYEKLNNLSPMPFSAFLKNNDQFVICASPERFLAKRGNKIISQPIKGTIRRGETAEEDERARAELFASEKERSENVMIVDLVRNDLSITAEKGSVQVEELFGVKTFPLLHHLISTIVSEKRANADEMDVIAKAFPMGSMTGAPKIRAMELIEKYENSKRGIYSGAIGYFDASENFDFNVVIRSIFYNQYTKTISFNVGSAITINANAESEYEECLLKAMAMMQILRH